MILNGAHVLIEIEVLCPLQRRTLLTRNNNSESKQNTLFQLKLPLHSFRQMYLLLHLPQDGICRQTV